MRKKQGPPASKSGYRKDDSRKPYGKKEDTRSNYGSNPRGKKDGDRPFRSKEEGGFTKEDRPFGDRKPYGKRTDRTEGGEGGFKKSYGEDRKPYGKRTDRTEGGEGSFKKSYGEDRKSYGKRTDRAEGGEGGFKKSYGEDRKPYGKRTDRTEGGEGGFRKSYGDDRKPGRKKDDGDKPFKKGDRKKDGKKNDAAEKNRFRDQDIFEKNGRGKRKEDDENYIINEHEGFSKKVEDKFGKKPRSKKQAAEDMEDDEDDFIDPKSIKKNATRYEQVQITSPMTLNKYIAHSGQCSRRDAAELVKKGKVRVNGELMLDPGYRVQPEDQVVLGGKKLTPQKNLVYILLNKPKGFITTTEDPEGRKTVMELVAEAEVDRLFPVGRLDRNTTGLLLLTNDGDLAQKLSHPKHEIKKIYQVTLDKNLSKTDFDKVVEGVELEDGMTKVDSLAYLENKNEVGLEIHSGRNRIVRRIFEALGYEVEKLDRVMYAGLTKKNISRGKWRFLTDHEVVLLKHFKN